MKSKLLYKGSVKDIFESAPGSLVFSFSDRYSVFDWGEMPDEIPGKGEALARFCLFLYRELENPKTWIQLEKDLSDHKNFEQNVSYSLRKKHLQKLQKDGLSHHLLGYFDLDSGKKLDSKDETCARSKALLVKRVEVPKPNFDSKTSRWLYCTSEFSKALEKPKLLPFEWIFRLGLTEGSSFLERLRKDQKLRNKWELQGRAGERFSRPLIEVSTKHEPVDRILNLKEAVEIVGAGVSSQKWEELFEVVSLVSLYLNFRFKKMGLNLWDGKVELALDKGAEVLLVDSIGPDELRIEKDGLQLNKEYLRQIYRKTKWYEGVLRAKERAEKEGIKDWKKLFEKEFKHHSVPRLPEELKRLISQMYQSLADCISDSEDANAQKSLEELIPGLKKHLEEGL